MIKIQTLKGKTCSGEAAEVCSVEGGASTAALSLSLSLDYTNTPSSIYPEPGRRGASFGPTEAPWVLVWAAAEHSRLEPWYSYTHWFPMASSHVKKDGPEPVPRMQPAMMMFSSKYWARRGLSLDSAMFDHQQQRHTGGQMVRTNTHLHAPPPLWPQHVIS